MAKHVCPAWVGYLLLNPLRRLFENPDKIFGRFVRPGMYILEPGCGMGYFTLPLARMVGPTGRVIAVDVQPKMLSALSRRARKAGLAERIDIRSAAADRLGIADLAGAVDFAALIHMVHETAGGRCHHRNPPGPQARQPDAHHRAQGPCIDQGFFANRLQYRKRRLQNRCGLLGCQGPQAVSL
jgi:SAM-dependent methyltransferase